MRHLLFFKDGKCVGRASGSWLALQGEDQIPYEVDKDVYDSYPYITLDETDTPVLKTEKQRFEMNRPTRQEVLSRRFNTLRSTDWMFSGDRPVNEDWKNYRTTLRDLGVYDTASDMIGNWPINPDGHDDIEDLRIRNGVL